MWGAIYEDSGFSLEHVRKAYSAVFPLDEALKEGEALEAGEAGADGGPAEATYAGGAAPPPPAGAALA